MQFYSLYNSIETTPKYYTSTINKTKLNKSKETQKTPLTTTLMHYYLLLLLTVLK